MARHFVLAVLVLLLVPGIAQAQKKATRKRHHRTAVAANRRSLNTVPRPAYYTLTNQQPVTTVFYPNTVWTNPLPKSISSHLLANNGFGYSGEQIVQYMFGGSDAARNSSYTASCRFATDCTSSFGNSFYYSSPSDPIYKVSGVGKCPTSPNATTANCPNGKYFHLPKGAEFDAAPVSQDDIGINLWDQSTDLDSTPGGRILTFYRSGTGLTKLPECSCKTKSCADTTSACQIGSGWAYGAVNFPFGAQAATGVGISSDGGPAGANFLREHELTASTVNHTIGLDVSCLAGSYGNWVYPATGDACHCGQAVCGSQSGQAANDRPRNGYLFWIDSAAHPGPGGSAYDCYAHGLGNWQIPVCLVMQQYGGVVHATGAADKTLYVMPLEGGIAWATEGKTDPFYTNWLPSNVGTLTYDSDNYTWNGGPYVSGAPAIKVVKDRGGNFRKVLLYFFQMPGLITGHHLHIADPCVAVAKAGLSSAGGITACP